jgi:hypothetical protein
MKMNVNPINQPTIVAPQTFKGKILTKGAWPKHLADEFKNHYVFKNIGEKDYNIVGTMLTKKVKKPSLKYFQGQNLYKIVLSAEKENPTKLQELQYKSGMNAKLELSEHYHSDDGTSKLMLQRIKPESIKKALNIEI